MKTLFKLLVSIFYFSQFSLESWAAPAADLDIMVSQPAGAVPESKSFRLHHKGDEWGSWYETDEGFTVIKQDLSNVWHYGELDVNKKVRPSGKVLGRENPDAFGIKRHVRPEPTVHHIQKATNSSFRSPTVPPPSKAGGTATSPTFVGSAIVTPSVQQVAAATLTLSVPTLFILVHFSDRAGTYTPAYFAGLLTNQLKAYYNEASYGRFNLTPANETHGLANDGVVGWLTLNQRHPNTVATTGVANQQLAADAIAAADPYVDFASYDVNGDGYVDSNELAIVIIPAGYEAAFGGSTCTPSPSVWGHRWVIQSPVVAPVVDGKIVGDSHNGAGGYAQFGEIQGAAPACNATNAANLKDHLATIGIMAHELGHLILKLPDLYDTTYLSQGIGNFSLMAAGTWGFKTTEIYQGQSPVHPDAWCKYTSGWVNPVVNSTGSVAFPAVGGIGATSANAVQMQTTSDPNQYFLFENRGQFGYDAGLSGLMAAFPTAAGTPGGLAIWRIDESMRTATTLWTPNNIVAHKFIDLKEADNVANMDANLSRGDANDLYFLGNNSSFGDLTSPNSKLYSGAATGITLSSISAPSQNMTGAFAILQSTQTITFTSAPTLLIVGGTSSLVATSTSGLTVTFSSQTPTICSVVSATVTALAAGSCSVVANQAGNATYAAAPSVTSVITVSVTKTAQTITFTSAPTSIATNSTGTLAATSSSGLAVTLSSTTPTICSVAGTKVTPLLAGSCGVAANQAGNATIAAAPQVTKTISIVAAVKSAQTITFSTAPASLTVKSTGNFVATATSGLAVTFSTSTPTVCSIASGKVTGLLAGTCTVLANQAGNASFNPAPQVSKSFPIK